MTQQLGSRAAVIDDCIQTSGGFRFELHASKEMLLSSKANALDLEHVKNMLAYELTTVTSQLDNLDQVKTTLQGELKFMIAKYISIRKEKVGVDEKYRLSYIEAKSLRAKLHEPKCSLFILTKLCLHIPLLAAKLH
eukprot:gene1891-33305_t